MANLLMANLIIFDYVQVVSQLIGQLTNVSHKLYKSFEVLTCILNDKFMSKGIHLWSPKIMLHFVTQDSFPLCLSIF